MVSAPGVGGGVARRLISPTAWASARTSAPSRSPVPSRNRSPPAPVATDRVTRSASDFQSGRPG